MADHIRTIDRMLQARPIDMRALLRLATWGCAAAAALMLAVLSGTMGSNRATLASSTGSSTPGDLPRSAAQVPAATVPLAARATEPDNTTRQLSEAVSGLAADRDRLVARIASVERNLEDVTGSIKQQAVSPPPRAADPAPLPALAPAPTAPPPAPRSQSQPEPAPPSAVTAAPPPPAAATPPIVTAPAAPSSATVPPEPLSTRVANIPETPGSEPAKSRIVDFGIDIGGSTTFEGLRALWNSVRGATADLFDDLHPMVAVRESKSRGVDLRLVVGPLTSTEAATQMCATLLAARRYCQMTIFEGQPLPQTGPVAEPERRSPPPATPTRTSGQTKSVRPPPPRP